MILLSFDTEEFDVPREHGVDFTLEQGMAVSKAGTNCILDVLKQNGVKASAALNILRVLSDEQPSSSATTGTRRGGQ